MAKRTRLQESIVHYRIRLGTNQLEMIEMIPGETLRSGAPAICPDCKIKLKLEVLQTPAGYYIGTYCNCGPYSRESHYYRTREKAYQDLENGTVNWR